MTILLLSVDMLTQDLNVRLVCLLRRSEGKAESNSQGGAY